MLRFLLRWSVNRRWSKLTARQSREKPTARCFAIPQAAPAQRLNWKAQWPELQSRRFVTIVDPVQGTSTVLDVAAKSVTVFHLSSVSPVTTNNVKLMAPLPAGRASVKHLTPPGSEELGEMMVEGFAATGSRRTSTAKGALPNVVTESWFSKVLKVDLLVSRQGPHSVSRTTRLTNITPGEPDPTVFQVPADYTVRDNSQSKGVTQ